jgi:hypothetical protein
MEKTDDIDLMLVLNPHGWATCYFSIKSEITELPVTLIFGDPFSDLIQTLTEIIENKKESEFYLFGEPGGNRIKISKIMTQQNKVNIVIEEFEESFGKEIKNYETKISFEIKIKHLLILFYNQLEKIEMLMEDKEYSDKRKNDFPNEQFHKFKRKFTEFNDRKS